MNTLIVSVVVIAAVLIISLFGLAVRIVRQYEQGVVFRFGRLRGSRAPGLQLIIPFSDVMYKVSLRIVTMPIQSQGIITMSTIEEPAVFLTREDNAAHRGQALGVSRPDGATAPAIPG